MENSDKEWSVNLRGALIRNVPPPQAEEEAVGAGREYGVKGRGCWRHLIGRPPLRGRRFQVSLISTCTRALLCCPSANPNRFTEEHRHSKSALRNVSSSLTMSSYQNTGLVFCFHMYFHCVFLEMNFCCILPKKCPCAAD